MAVKGYQLLVQALLKQGVRDLFFLMGGPMLDSASECERNGIRMIDVRHEQSAAMMAHAYARLRGVPGVCMACSGPGSINLTTGLANALIDCAPVVALGGSSPVGQYGLGAFQEIDQLAIMRPVTKWADRVYEARRIPEYVFRAFQEARSGKPGPVYLDLPGDVLHHEVDEADVKWPKQSDAAFYAKAAAPAEAVDRALALLQAARKPVLLSGSGVIWSGAAAELQRFVEATGIPFYTTPQGRGVVPEDHEYFYASARSTAFKDADLFIIAGTRLNYVFGFGRPPRLAANARQIRIDVDPTEIANGTADLGITGDAATVLRQLNAAIAPELKASYAEWRSTLSAIEVERQPKQEAKLTNDQVPIHPLRLCKEIRDFMDRDAILVVDGQEILNYGRQSIPSFVPGHRLNSGPLGTMGVGVPFGVGAKAAKPEKQVIVLEGDGAFGLNGMELDTAIRHKLPILVVISLNGGWTADPDGKKVGRNLGYTHYERMAEALGCHGEFVEDPAEIRPALQRASEAVARGQTALVNVVTDWRARAEAAGFTRFST